MITKDVMTMLREAHELLTGVMQDLTITTGDEIHHNLIGVVNASAEMAQDAMSMAHDLGYGEDDD